MTSHKPITPPRKSGWARMSLADKIFTLIGLLVVMGCLAVLVWPSILFPPPHGHHRLWCRNNLKQIGLAIHNYHDVHGEFPPAYFTDAEGTPTHSWRVLILPYLEEQNLYDQYDFSQPWNSEHNLALASHMPEAYRCPNTDSEFAALTTGYVAVVGPETAWPGAESRKDLDFRDGFSNTLLVIESETSRTHWMAPSDAQFSQLVPLDASGKSLLTTSSHHNGFSVVYADCSVDFLKSDIRCDRVRALLTIAGDELVPAR